MKRTASEEADLQRQARASALATNVLLVQAANAIAQSAAGTRASCGEHQSPLAAADSDWNFGSNNHCEQGFERLATLVKSQLLSQFPSVPATSEPSRVPNLRNGPSDARIELTSLCIVGRSTICHVKINDAARVVSRFSSWFPRGSAFHSVASL